MVFVVVDEFMKKQSNYCGYSEYWVEYFRSSLFAIIEPVNFVIVIKLIRLKLLSKYCQ